MPFETYISSCVKIAQEKLSHYCSIAEIAAHEKEINCYERLRELHPPRHVHILKYGQQSQRVSRAKACLVQGKVLFEHAAAGEGTRLLLGPKYLLNVARDWSLAKVAEHMSKETGSNIEIENIIVQLKDTPERLLPLSLGARHMLQLAFDLAKLAEQLEESPREVLLRQHLLVVLSEEILDEVSREFFQWHFFGFNPEQVLFMVQQSFHGLNLKDGHFFYDEQSPLRLHNHGQMVLQQTMDRQLFALSGNNPSKKNYYIKERVADWLGGFEDKISYNIEDLDYLTGSLDLEGLGLALELGEAGCNMVMEVVANNPLKPQKGGMLAWDPYLGRDVMIESFQLGDLENKDIKYLNRNFNHYPKPWVSWECLGSQGLPMPITIKDGYVYFQPVQGDINFLVKTAFFRREDIRPICNLKTPAQFPLAINCMLAQDRQPGFRQFVQNCQQGRL